jgi:hypothetical protein
MQQVLLIELPAEFIRLCDISEVSPQAVLRGMAAIICGLHVEESREALSLYAAPESAHPGH